MSIKGKLSMLNKHIIAASLFGLFSAASQAQDLDITLTNLTQGIAFTPAVVASHDASSYIFHSTQAASAELQLLAEGGATEDLTTLLGTYSADVENSGGLLLPGESVKFTPFTNSDGNNYLSLASMMLPTNDGFIGLDSWKIPTEAGTYTVYLNAYDAGTEANDELIGSIPNPPPLNGQNAGVGATGVTTEIGNATVHIHPGVIGDNDATGGISDFDSSKHRWLNPVAKLTIVVE